LLEVIKSNKIILFIPEKKIIFLIWFIWKKISNNGIQICFVFFNDFSNDELLTFFKNKKMGIIINPQKNIKKLKKFEQYGFQFAYIIPEKYLYFNIDDISVKEKKDFSSFHSNQQTDRINRKKTDLNIVVNYFDNINQIKTDIWYLSYCGKELNNWNERFLKPKFFKRRIIYSFKIFTGKNKKQIKKNHTKYLWKTFKDILKLEELLYGKAYIE
jgi:hypothetical protein